MLLAPQDVLYFQTIAKTKNLRAAAEALHVTQPALSHSLKRLECSFEEALFERTSKGLKLTVRGAKLLEQSTEAMEVWRGLAMSAEDTVSAVRLRVGMHPSVATYFAGEFLRRVQASSRSLGFDFVHGLSRDVTRMVIDGELDLAIAINPVRSPGLMIREVLTDTVSFVATKAGMKSKHLVYDPSLAQSQWLLKSLERRGVTFESQTHSSSLEVIRSVAEAGLAVAILPKRVAALSKVELTDVFVEGPVYRDKLCFVSRPHLIRTSRGRIYLEAAKATAALLEDVT